MAGHDGTDMTVQRYESDGTLDEDFGVSGSATMDFGVTSRADHVLAPGAVSLARPRGFVGLFVSQGLDAQCGRLLLGPTIYQISQDFGWRYPLFTRQRALERLCLESLPRRIR